jgi:hypothetical protein
MVLFPYALRRPRYNKKAIAPGRADVALTGMRHRSVSGDWRYWLTDRVSLLRVEFRFMQLPQV